MSNVAYDNIDRWKRDLEKRKRPQMPDGGGPVPPGPSSSLNQMGERLARLEGAFDWIKVTITVISTVVIGGIAFLGVQIARVDSRVSALSDKVDALPEKVNAGLRDLTNTLAQAILASKQIAPQVVLLPAPQPSAPQQRPASPP